MNDDHLERGLFPDEPWEAEISRMLGGLAPVDPPPGFIDQAIDRRPLFAGRSLVALATAAAFVFGASFALGAFGQPRIVPELSTLTSGAAVRSGATTAVFRQPGVVELDELPGGQRTTVDGRDAWVDAENEVIVIATEASVVTMVGVSVEEAEALLDEVDHGPEGSAGLINRLTAGVGFPDLS